MKIDWSKIPSANNEDVDEKTLHLLEVYIDDFVGMIQSTNEDEIRRFTRCILKGITDIFPQPSETNSKMGPPISPKKLEEDGDHGRPVKKYWVGYWMELHEQYNFQKRNAKN